MIVAIKSNLGRVYSFHKQMIKTFNFSSEKLITVGSFCLPPEKTLDAVFIPRENLVNYDDATVHYNDKSRPVLGKPVYIRKFRRKLRINVW